MKKFLKCYPFVLLSPRVKLVEEFGAYIGVLGDEPGKPHKGIDFARKDGYGKFISFDVFSTHGGEAFQGISDSWGGFVIIYLESRKFRIATVCAHLDKIDESIPCLPKEKEKRNKGLIISEGRFLGTAGTTGDTKGNIQLHFELLRRRLNKKDAQWKKLDPRRFWVSKNLLFANQITENKTP